MPPGRSLRPRRAAGAQASRGVPRLSDCSSLYRSGRNATIHRPGREVFGRNGAEGENRPVAEVHARLHGGPRAYPRVGAELNGISVQRERRVLVIVRGPADVSLLRDDGVRSHMHGWQGL